MHGQQNFETELSPLSVLSENVRQMQIWYAVLQIFIVSKSERLDRLYSSTPYTALSCET